MLDRDCAVHVRGGARPLGRELWAQCLEAHGWVIVPGPQMLSREAEPTRGLAILSDVAVPLVEALVGAVVLADWGRSVPAGWHRGWDASVRSGAPPAFVPGFDVYVSDGPVDVALVSGSGRLSADEAVPEALAVSVSLLPGTLLLSDCRLWRRVASPVALTRYLLLRAWLSPVRVLADTDDHRLGAGCGPDRDVSAWLDRVHPRRGGA